MKDFKELAQGGEGVSGTRIVDREETMSSIIDSHQESMSVTVRGVDLNLKANWSLSKKTVCYYSSLTKDEYIDINGSSFGFKKNQNKFKASFTIGMDGRSRVDGGGNYYYDFPTNQEIKINE